MVTVERYNKSVRESHIIICYGEAVFIYYNMLWRSDVHIYIGTNTACACVETGRSHRKTTHTSHSGIESHVQSYDTPQ